MRRSGDEVDRFARGATRSRAHRLTALALSLALAACTQAVPDPTTSPAGTETPTVGQLPTDAPQETGGGGPVPPVAGDDLKERSSQALIQRAVEEGRLDFATSLLYRAYAFFEDPRLPDEFRGDGSLHEDPGLFILPDAMGDELPEGIRQQLDPFLVPPTDPTSIFSEPDDTAAYGPQVGALGPVVGLGPSAQLECRDGWASRHATVPIKVWARCTGSYEREIAAALDVVNKIWRPMTALMGRPKLDRGGDESGLDESIDLYLSADNVCPKPPQAEACYPLSLESGEAMGWARRLPPRDQDANGSGTSGFMVVQRGFVLENPKEFRRTLIHELFHVLQYAHVGHGMAYKTGATDKDGKSVWATLWFTEASATWAEYHFERLLGDHESGILALKRRYSPFQARPASLHSLVPPDHRYGAAVWPYFMVQKRGGAQVIADTWKALSGKTDWHGMMDAISGRLPFRSNFREFALANLNATIHDPDPLPVRFQDFDAKFPEILPAGPHNHEAEMIEPRGDPYRLPDEIPPLGATYWHFQVGDDVEQLTLDFSGLSPSATLGVDALLLLPDSSHAHGMRYVHRPLPNGETKFCRNREEEEVMFIKLVLSNHDYDGVPVKGEYTIEATEEPCRGYGIAFRYVGESTAAESVSYSATGYLEPNEEGELVGEATVEGTFWEATRFGSGGEVEYCVAEPIYFEYDLFGAIVGDRLYVFSVPKEDTSDMRAILQIEVGGEVPAEGGTTTVTEPALYSPDGAEPDGVAFCPEWAHRTTTLTATPRGD